MRLDSYLVNNLHFKSRTNAQAVIMAGKVMVNDRVVDKASFEIKENHKVEVVKSSQYVSRGAHKLIKALDEFNVDVKEKTVLDAGASTGGFSQVLLERGARKVIAVDVGYGQFDYKLRNDSRVELLERCNIRYLDPSSINKVDIVVADLSFISILKVVNNLKLLSIDDAEFIFLIKPQFEAEPKLLKKGVIRESQIHKDILTKVISKLLEEGLFLKGLTFSPIKGPKGNIEFLAYLSDTRSKESKNISSFNDVINSVVEQAHHLAK